MGVIRHWFCLLCLTATSLAAAASPAPPPNIILITLDTTRADRMGFLGSTRGLTPNLDALARRSAVFTHAYSQVPITTASHATILTGTYPQFNQVNDFRVPLAKDLPYIPDILHARGYHTAAFLGSIVLDPSPTYAPGFDRGFDTYDAGFHHEGLGENRYRTVERRGSVVVAHALSWLAKHPKGPFFLWVHLYDAHDPYDPPEPYKTRYAAEPYDGEIAYADAAVGRLLRELKLRGLYDGAVIAVMADHGESLGAHGEDTHGIFLYDETIQVPLVIKLPHATVAEKQIEKRIENRVELVDVMPTILQAVGMTVPPQVQGESLLPIMKTRAAQADMESSWRDRPAYAETDYPRIAFGWSALQSLRSGKYLFVQAPRRELYDQTSDPKAEHNLASASTAVAETLAARIDAFRQKTGNKREAPKAAVDPSAQENLAALGYVASTSSSQTSSSDHRADPKDRIEIANLMRRANMLQEDGRFEEAVPLLQRLTVEDPGMPVYSKLGECFMRLKAYDKAVPALRKAVEMNPDSPMEHFQLAKGLIAAEQIEAAVPELEMVVAKLPNLADAHLFLEMAYARTNRVPETIKECQKVLEFQPDHFGSYLILGRFLELAGDLEGAVPNLKKAASLDPKAPDPHIILADVYDHMGRTTDAAHERAVAARLKTSGH
jgi:arylsulfatase A-like enzyme/Tfp pilus assembly protein PilF